jgi:TonB family protein
LKAKTLFASVLLAAASQAQQAGKPVVYNEVEGDGSLALDRQIKAAYASAFTIIDARRSDGFAEPIPSAGSLPGMVRDQGDSLLGGFVLVAYVVTSGGLVADPVVLKSTDRRLTDAALEAMKGWRFIPATLKGVAVATTAAQDFSFGPLDLSNGFTYDRLVMYQSSDVLFRRLPGRDDVNGYLAELRLVAHNFFLGASTPETLQIVFIAQPGRRPRFWFVSSVRAGDAPELAPLRRLLEAVAPLAVHDGPVALAIAGRVAGGDGVAPLIGKGFTRPVPAEWKEAVGAANPPLPVFSDEYLNLVWSKAR